MAPLGAGYIQVCFEVIKLKIYLESRGKYLELGAGQNDPTILFLTFKET